MGYQVWKEGKTWRLVFQKGKKIKKRVVNKRSREAAELGFRPELTLKEAQARATQLRDEKWAKDHAEQAAKTKNILEKYQKLRGAFLTDDDVEEFERDWIPEKRIRKEHWHTIQKIIVDIALHPSEWYKFSSKIYEQFAKRRYSPTYCKKLLRYLNIWGYYLCEKQSRAWKDVERPDSHWRRKIEDAFSKRIKRSGFESAPISPEMVHKARTKLHPEHYSWLLISAWFGLRPREVNNLLSDNIGLYKIERNKEHGFVLHVFQEKLYERGTPREKCWKLIPTYFPEQREVIATIRSKKFKQPITKIIKRCLGDHCTAYGGRKNFVDMLRAYGFELEVASRWMGHLSVKTTEKSYSKVDTLIYRPPKKLVG